MFSFILHACPLMVNWEKYRRILNAIGSGRPVHKLSHLLAQTGNAERRLDVRRTERCGGSLDDTVLV